MARRPKADERQAELFGPVPMPAAPEPDPVPQSKSQRDSKRPLSPQDDQGTPEQGGVAKLATGLSAAELNELAAALSDNALAHLALAAVRQLRRRLMRRGGRGRSRTSALERTARQIAAELSGEGEGYDI